MGCLRVSLKPYLSIKRVAQKNNF